MITITVKLKSAKRTREIEGVLVGLGCECEVNGLDEAERLERIVRIKGLTGAEAEVFAHLAQGRDLRRTRAAMGVSHQSAKRWAESARVRLGLESLDALIAYARGGL